MVLQIVNGIDTEGVDAKFFKLFQIPSAAINVGNGILNIRVSACT